MFEKMKFSSFLMHLRPAIAVGIGSIFFAALLVLFVFPYHRMFMKIHGRRHIMTGMVYLGWLLMGFSNASFQHPGLNTFAYDIMLGMLGTALTLTAAFDFNHKHVKNVASGTLDEHATVTTAEMIEHSFYQVLNLIQVVYLHMIRPELKLHLRLLLCILATLPWIVRHRFPIHKFSDNYVKMDQKSTPLIRFLYRLKKYQYVFYKHFLLHGLNISVAFSGIHVATLAYFRQYWILLNTAYVMEFFLQTLVKRKYMKQESMLVMQKILMVASSAGAIAVLQNVNFIVAAASVALNFVKRQNDVGNTCLIIIVCVFIHQQNFGLDFSSYFGVQYHDILIK